MVEEIRASLVLADVTFQLGSSDAEFNGQLSQDRAESVRQYLIKQGVEADRITARGYGEDHPMADNGTREGREANRRVELKRLDS